MTTRKQKLAVSILCLSANLFYLYL
uniref:Uncharacterized protein n=1 Tax=Anguilla anguilla TaxID=7936 RepID=A0A0E9TNP7_ANGAN